MNLQVVMTLNALFPMLIVSGTQNVEVYPDPQHDNTCYVRSPYFSCGSEGCLLPFGLFHLKTVLGMCFHMFSFAEKSIVVVLMGAKDRYPF